MMKRIEGALREGEGGGGVVDRPGNNSGGLTAPYPHKKLALIQWIFGFSY
mgnify:CR=1 FL=1